MTSYFFKACVWTALMAVSALGYAEPTKYRLTEVSVGPTNTYATDFNSSGMVSGYSYQRGEMAKAFVWNGTEFLPLGIEEMFESHANGINEAGNVVGTARENSNSHDQAFFFDGASLTLLGTLGGSYSWGRVINDAGQIAGAAQHFGGALHAFLWDNGTMHDLGTLGGDLAVPTAMNEAGQVVGYSSLAGNAGTHAFLWDGGQLLDLGTVGGNTSTAWDINAAAQVVGSAEPPEGYYHAFYWDNGLMQDLGTFGGPWSESNAINEIGLAVGTADSTAFVWNGTEKISLGTLGGAYSNGFDINDAGYAVGTSYPADNQEVHGFVWDGTSLHDLNDLIDAQDALYGQVVITQALRIRNDGLILAQGRRTDSQLINVYVLTPLDVEAMLAGLWETVADVGPGTSLRDKVALARTYYLVPDVQSSCGVMQALIRQLSALTAKQLTSETVAVISQDAEKIIEAMACE